MKYISFQQILAVASKELRVYFNSPIAYVFLIFFLVTASWLFMRQFFLIGQSSMQLFFDLAPWLFMLFVAAVTMRQIAEEKKMGTIEILMTLPVRDYDVVLGKFLASLGFLALALLLSFPMPLLLGIAGDPDFGQILGSYLGLLFLGGAFLSIGLYISSMTKNQITAFIIAFVISLALFLLSIPLVVDAFPKIFAPVVNYLGIASHYASISRGVIDSRDLIYFISLMGFFLFLTTRSLEKGKFK